MGDQATGIGGGTTGTWNAEQAARAMAVGGTAETEPTAVEAAVRNTGPQHPMLHVLRNGRISAEMLIARAALGAGMAILWSISGFPNHAASSGASIGGAGTAVPPVANQKTEHQTMIADIQGSKRSHRTDPLPAGACVSAALALGSMIATTASADSAGHRFADFAYARATIDVAGSAVYDAQNGYTAECRIWIDTVPITTNDSYPASIMFQHRSGQDHKWLAIHSGRGTGFAVDSTGSSWWNRKWVDTATTIPTGRWIHLAHVIGGDGIDRIYLDGELSGQTPNPVAGRLNGPPMRLGAAVMADFNREIDSFGGKLDWIRVSSIARYNGTVFVVPTEDELVPDPQTNLLITFNGSGSDGYTDLSPNHYPLSPGQGISGGTAPAIIPDCNDDGIDDRVEIASGLLADSNADGIPDTCQCGANPSLPACCKGDIFQDGLVNGADLGALLSYWGPVTSAPASALCDLDHDGLVGGGDLGILLANWGACGG